MRPNEISTQQTVIRPRASAQKRRINEINPAAFTRSEHDRSQSASERLRSTDARLETTNLRDENAARRDRIADDRDEAARARDQLAAAIDAEIELLEREHDNGNGNGGPVPARTELLRRLTAERRRAATNRARAADQRDAAARDRQLAAEDRDRAHHDRRAAAEALERESIDHLTGALGRRAGRAAIQREMARATRFGETLVLIFVDVDGLKATNDDRGHLAGDSVLRATARCLTEGLRAYDVVMRFGGDEFVCTLSDQDADGAQTRVAHIAARLAEVAEGQTITVGLPNGALTTRWTRSSAGLTVRCSMPASSSVATAETRRADNDGSVDPACAPVLGHPSHGHLRYAWDRIPSIGEQ